MNSKQGYDISDEIDIGVLSTIQWSYKKCFAIVNGGDFNLLVCGQYIFSRCHISD